MPLQYDRDPAIRTPRHPFFRTISGRAAALGLAVLLAGAVTYGFLLPAVQVSMTDALVIDTDGDSKADVGDQIRYSVQIGNTGDEAAEDVDFDVTLDALTELVAGSVKTTPLARGETYQAIGHVGISVPAGSGVLVNDVDFDGDAITLDGVMAPGSNVGSPVGTVQGGTVQVSADGSFDYVSPIGFTGNDTFTYTIEDPDGNVAQATVTIEVSPVLWVIDNSVGGANEGTLADPFTSIASFNASADPGAGDRIYLAETGTDYADGIVLENDQVLIGEGAPGASLQAVLGITLPPFSDALPPVGGTRPVIGGVTGAGITLASGNTVRGLNVGDTSGNGITDGGGSVGTLTIGDVSITDTGGAIRVASGGTLAVALGEASANTVTAGGILLAGVSGSFGVTSGAIDVAGAAAIDITGNPSVAVAATFSQLSTTGSPLHGIRLQGLTGTGVTVSGPNVTTDVNAPAGSGIVLKDSPVSFSFADVVIDSRGATGIVIDNVDGAAVTFGDANIPNQSNATGYGIQVQNSTADVTFASSDISNTVSSSAQTPANTASGPPTNAGDGDGIFLSSNTGSFTITGTGAQGNGGSFAGIAGDAIDVRSSADVSVSKVTITAPGGDGFQAYNLSGNSAILQSTIADVQSSRAGIEWYGDAAAGSGSLTVSSTQIDGVAAATANIGILVETRTNSHTATLLVDDVGGAAGDMVIEGFNGSAVVVASGAQGGSGTVYSTLQGATVRNADGLNGQNGITHGMNGNSNLTVLIDDVVVSNVMRFGGTLGAIAFGNGAGATGLLSATVTDTQITDSNQAGITAAPQGGAMDYDVEFSGNTLNDIDSDGIRLRSDFGASGEASIRNNVLGVTTIVGGATGVGLGHGMDLRVRDGGLSDAACGGICPTPTFTALVENNTVRTGNDQEAVDIDIEDAATANVTVRNNTFNNTAFAAGGTDFEINTEDAGSVLCLDLTGNSASGGGTFYLTEDAGTFSVEGPGVLAVTNTDISDANAGSGSVSPPGSILYNNGVNCLLPATTLASAEGVEDDTPAWSRPDVMLARHAIERDAAPPGSGEAVAAAPAKRSASTGTATSLIGLGAGWNPVEPAAVVVPSMAPRAPLSRMASLATAAGESIHLDIGMLGPGESFTIQFDADVVGPFTAGVTQICQQATVSGSNITDVLSDDPDVGGATDPTCTPIDAAPDLVITKSDGVATSVVPGDPIIYQIEVENVGTQDASGVVVTETVPQYTTFNASGSSLTWSCADGSPAGTICTYAVGDVAVGETKFPEFAVTVVNPVPVGAAEVSNTATVADDGSGGADPTPANNSVTEVTPIDAEPELIVNKTDALIGDSNGDGEANPGEVLIYTIVVLNVGTQDAADVVLLDPAVNHLHSELIGGSVTTTQGTVIVGNPGPAADVLIDLGTVAPGGGPVVVTFLVQIVDPFPPGATEVCNQAIVDGSNFDAVWSDHPGIGGTADPTCTPVISNLAPEITSVDPASQTVQYSDAIDPITIVAEDDERPDGVANLTLATEWSVDGGAATPGLPGGLVVTGDPADCTVTDGKSCEWTVSGQMLQPAGSIVLSFVVSDSELESLAATSSIEVEAEDVAVSFDGSNEVAVQVPTAGGASGPFILVIEVEEHDDPSGLAGDIDLAGIQVSLVPVGPGSPVAPVTPCTDTTESGDADAGGTADIYDTRVLTCSFDDVPVNTYAIGVDVNHDGYYLGHEEDVLVVYDPSLGFTTGGGWFYWPGTEDGEYPGDKTTFGYNIKYNKKATNTQGSAIVVRHLADDSRYRMKSNALSGLSIGNETDWGWASFAGKATYQRPFSDAEGNHEFVIYVEDHGTPGVGNDRFWVRILKDGVPVEVALPLPGATYAQTLQGGNIVVPHGGKGQGKGKNAAGKMEFDETEIPEVFALHPSYPNPFNPVTTLTLDVPEEGELSVSVYDILGRRVRVLVDGVQAAGVYRLAFEADTLPSGLYVVVADTPVGRLTRTVTLLK
jgi:uncharacterized repeat protein (TIGR01451 family)